MNKKIKEFLSTSLAWLLLFVFIDSQPLQAKTNYKIIIPPEYLEIVMWERYSPLINELENRLKISFELVIPRSFDEHIELVRNGSADFSYQNSYLYMEIQEYCQSLVITEKNKKWGIECRGVIITKKNSVIKNVEALEGKKISAVSPHSAEGYISQKISLRGVFNIDKDLTIVFPNRMIHEEVVSDVLNGRADAGFISEELLGKPDAISRLSSKSIENLDILSYSGYIPNWIFSSNKNLKSEVRKGVKDALLQIPEGDPALKKAGIRRFLALPSFYLDEFREKVMEEEY